MNQCADFDDFLLDLKLIEEAVHINAFSLTNSGMPYFIVPLAGVPSTRWKQYARASDDAAVNSFGWWAAHQPA